MGSHYAYRNSIRIENPLTIEQLREKVEKWNRREAQP